MNPVYTTSAGKSVTLEKQLGSGGEGEVWTVQGRLDVAKIYHPKIIKPEHERKLKAMVANPPVDEMRVKGHVSIAWPNDLLYQGGKFAGFLMPMLEQSPTIFTVYNPVKRKKECPGFNWKYLFHTALNLSKAIEAIHYKNYVIGDLNESNILVKASALVSVIDTDSFQVRDANGQVYHCKVGKEDFTPPELLGVPLDKVDRLPEHDYFGLGVLIFRLLMEGYYPYTGVLKQDVQLNEPVQYYCLKQGAFPYVKNGLVAPPLMAPPFDILPREVRNLFMRCFVAGHKNIQARPSPREWGQVLESAEKELVACKANKEHYYARHLAGCPWCQREKNPVKAPLQTPLPPARASRPSIPIRSVLPSLASILPVAPASAPPVVASPVAAPPAVTATSLATGPSRMAAPLRWLRFGSIRRWLRSARDALRRFFRSPGGYLNWRIWWSGTRKYTLFGGLAGLGLFLLLFLVFWFPIVVGYISGALTGGLIVISVLLIARTLFIRPSNRAKGVGAIVLLCGSALAAFAGFHVSNLVSASLSAWWPQIGILFLDCFLIGTLGGTAYGNYKTLSRRKSSAIASSTSLLLAGAPFLIIGIMKVLGLPLPL
jgi:serine/threonine protein kinase